MNMNSSVNDSPIELFDDFIWTKQSKILPREQHGISGLGNVTHYNSLSTTSGTVMHYHHNIIEISCLFKGRRECRIFDRQKNSCYAFKGSEALIVFPDEPHITGSNGLEPCDMYALQFNLSEGGSFLGLNPENGQRLCNALLALKHRHIKMSSAAFSLLKMAFSCFADLNTESYREGAIFLCGFLYTLLRLPAVDTVPVETTNDCIYRVLNYIQENIAQPLTLGELASCAGYSLSRFKVLFRKVTGQTPSQYIAMKKVEQAKSLLCRTDHSITDIAYELGWSSSNYFCAVFKKYANVSPLLYRKIHHSKGE